MSCFICKSSLSLLPWSVSAKVDDQRKSPREWTATRNQEVSALGHHGRAFPCSRTAASIRSYTGPTSHTFSRFRVGKVTFSTLRPWKEQEGAIFTNKTGRKLFLQLNSVRGQKKNICHFIGVVRRAVCGCQHTVYDLNSSRPSRNPAAVEARGPSKEAHAWVGAA